MAYSIKILGCLTLILTIISVSEQSAAQCSWVSTICEGYSGTISCPRNARNNKESKIRIIKANYGRTDRQTCQHENIRDTNCRNYERSLNVVRRRCDNKSTCTLHANNAEFGDKCVDTYKYLLVEYKCEREIKYCSSYNCASGPTCEKCILDYGENGNAYINKRHACIETCSWRSNLCYPGRCPGNVESCKCDDGFSGVHCRNIGDKYQPLFPSCEASLRRMVNGTDKDTVLGSCYTPGTTIYTNIQSLNHIQLKWITVFELGINNLTDPRKYILPNTINFGITNSSGIVEHKREESILNSLAFTCETRMSANYSSKITCKSNDSLTWEFKHNDRVVGTVYSTNGGRFMYENPETDETSMQYYNGQTSNKHVVFVFDTEPPYHCSHIASCHKPDLAVMDIGKDIRKEGVDVRWDGWNDNLAGVKIYECEIFLAISPDGKILVENASASYRMIFNKTSEDEHVCSFTPNITGTYSIILTVEDDTSHGGSDANYESARRLFIYDQNSTIDIVMEKPLRPISASGNTSFLWQTNLQDKLGNGPCVNFTWKDRFINRYHHTNKMLNAFGNFKNITPEYDDYEGERTLEEIPNANAIVMFNYTYLRDRKGANTLPKVPIDTNWYTADNVRQEGQAFNLERQDEDLMLANNALEGHVHAVHNETDLFKLQFTYKAYDLHSGLHSIHWELFDNHTGSKQTLGQNNTNVIRYNDTSPSDHYCVPAGQCYGSSYAFQPDYKHFRLPTGTHDHDYYMKLTVTNVALLVETHELKITIDTTPPHPGVVHDGLPGTPDVDFQQDFSLHAHWSEFFDRESGVKFYQYAFGRNCLGLDAFHPNNGIMITKTMNTIANINVTQYGKYHITVVAYNGAMSPSVPVCSTGVTIDITPPVLHSILVDHIHTKPGLVSHGNATWIVNEHGNKIKMTNTTCSGIEMTDVTIFPDAGHQSEEDDECKLGQFSNRFYLTQEKQLSLTWIGMDNESYIFDYEIGLSSTPSSMKPDVMPFHSTNQRASWRLYHPAISEGQLFYILVKATNRAKMITLKVFGPVILDVTEPVFDSDILIEEEKGYLRVAWDESKVYDMEDKEPLTFLIAIGSDYYHQDILSYRKLTSGPRCDSSHQNCTAIPMNELNLHPSQPQALAISILVINSAGLSTVAMAKPYVVYTKLPSQGMVIDVLPESEREDTEGHLGKDINFQLTTSSIRGKWRGFAHPHLNVSYHMGVGSVRGYDDIVPFMAVAGTEFEVTQLELEIFKTYYITVIAESSTGSVNATSNGVTVMANNHTIDISLHDGFGCKDKIITGHPIVPMRVCENDAIFQSSPTELSVHWELADNTLRYLTHALYRAEEYNKGSRGWMPIFQYRDVRPIPDHIVMANLDLDQGSTYRTIVKFCTPASCFNPVVTNGVTVHSTPPKTGNIDIAINKTSFGDVTIIFEEFDQNLYENQTTMNFYEWTASLDDLGNSIALPWKEVNRTSCKGHISFSFPIPTYIISNDAVVHKCWKLCIRGWSLAGLWSVKCKPFIPCDTLIKTRKSDAVVLDLRGPVVSNDDYLKHGDIDYTSSQNTLSAAWPFLQHGNYAWAVIERASDSSDDNTPVNICDDPETIVCGSTNEEYVNVFNLTLVQGRRYVVCVSANETYIQHERFEAHHAAVKTCSDGVIVDTTPPTAGTVILHAETYGTQHYQVSKSELFVSWTDFVDEDETSKNHHSGIKLYQYAIGTHLFGTDVVEFTSVGITNYHRITGLNLKDGGEYFVTIKALNHVDLSSEACSRPIIVDGTPPDLTNKAHVRLKNQVTQERDQVDASWYGVFEDRDSGILHYTWSIGTQPGFADISGLHRTKYTSSRTKPISEPLGLLDGHPYFVTVKAYNKAGLHTVTSSHAFVVDGSVPIVGHIYDGRRNETDKLHRDLDYQVDGSTLCAHWKGFTDPHTEIIEHLWQVGTCEGCDDIVTQHSIGLKTEVCMDYLRLSQGKTYYSTLTVCNQAGLCASLSTDGVTIDSSPPIAGVVEDGTQSKDIQFQASRTYISARWTGFHDSHSDIARYEVFVGTSILGDDILEPKAIHLTETIFVPLQTPLPLGRKIYVTVRAYNFAGLHVEASSNGFIIDQTPPEVIQPVSFGQYHGSARDNKQIWKSSMTITWEIDDKESGLERQYASVFTHRDGDLGIPTVEVGSRNHHTFTKLNLADGSEYYVTVIGCNKAQLCSNTTSSKLLVDSSRPSVGTFASLTNHASDLDRYRDGFMTWNATVMTLQWLGFTDHHSGISHYFITAGNTFAGHEYTQNSPILIAHNAKGTKLEEGVIQHGYIPTNGNLKPNSKVFIKLWAINGVGLPSLVVHSAFDVILVSASGGVLVIVRRCSTYSCEGNCVCAPQDQLCEKSDNCKVIQPNEYLSIEVNDTQDIRRLEQSCEFSDDMDFTHSDCLLAATWNVIGSNEKVVQRYEYSAGKNGSYSGSGVFNTQTDRVWFEAGFHNHAVVTPTRRLQHGDTYVFYVRAWYDNDTYTVFSSDGITIDITPPRVSKMRQVDESDDHNVPFDKDYTRSLDNISVKWTGVFSDFESGISHYMLGIGTHIQVDDSYTFTKYNTTIAHLKKLSLVAGQKYFTTVIAVANNGLESSKASDGFIVDVEPPTSGIVIDGRFLHDSDYTNRTTILHAQWHGFYDRHSGIGYYIVCVGTTENISHCDIFQGQSVGLQTSITIVPKQPLKHGMRYFTKVQAIDAAGLASKIISSDGICVDTTPPDIMHTDAVSRNLLGNPSFEKDTPAVDINDYHLWYNATIRSPKYWDTKRGTRVIIVNSKDGEMKDGDQACMLFGSLIQQFQTIPGVTYSLRFFVSHAPDPSLLYTTETGRVRVAGKDQILSIYPRQELPPLHNGHPNMNIQIGSLVAWHKHLVPFIAIESTSTLTIETLDFNSGFLIDDVIIEQLAHNDTEGDIEVTYQQAGEWSSIQASWQVLDMESNIAEVSWAIGLVRGGIQLQPYKSVGKQSHGINTKLHLMEGMTVHVTLMVRNNADLARVIYSEPLVIDHTAPVIEYVWDGKKSDGAYQAGVELTVTWKVEDKETPVSHCQVAFGYVRGLDDIYKFTNVQPVLETPMTFSTRNFTSLKHGTIIYATVRCFNNLGLWSEQSSNGVTILKTPSNVQDAFVDILSNRISQFQCHEGFHNDLETLRIKWTGVQSQSNYIHHYEVHIVDKYDNDRNQVYTIGQDGRQQGQLDSLQFQQNKRYKVKILAVDHLGVNSEDFCTMFVIEAHRPNKTGVAMTHTWMTDASVRLLWSNAFISSSELYYEVTVGTKPGGTNVMKWFETKATSITLNDVDNSLEHYLTVTAINKAGFHTSESYQFSFDPNQP
ncbi:unnamed protein product [Owenia fusiformis]|uniref:SUEL-type lectin domain-containing protein n=1 Tax=Owenia fusiformis TaxID=6347 RepID=A0A8S4PT88_OWEFU|nr:unnamed protein product [Owenia fusiformis]